MVKRSKWRSGLLGAAGVVLAAPSLVALTSVPAAAFTGESISGVVFRDFNANGVKDALEPGQAGIQVKAVAPDGTASAVATTDSAGAYTISLVGLGTAAGQTYRVEFVLSSLPTYLRPGQVPDPATVGATRNGGDVQFVVASGATATANFGVENPAQYCQSNPNVVNTCFAGTAGAPPDRATIDRFPYQSGTTSLTSNTNLAIPAPTTLANRSATGAIGAIAYQRSSSAIFVAAFAKRHVGYSLAGPADNTAPDKIFVRNSAGTLSTFFTQDAGTDAHDYASMINDVAFWDQVGKSAWGNITVSEDGTTLYAVNQFDRLVYAIAINPTSPTPTAGAVTTISFANATTDCGSDDWRPGAVTDHDGTVYLGITCTAQTSQLKSDLKGIIYKYTGGATATVQVANVALNYTRGKITDTNISANWWPWTGALPTIDNSNGCAGGQYHPVGMTAASYCQSYYPQPWMLSITFDESNNLIMGLGDRAGHQFGNSNNAAGDVEGVSAGDTVRLTPSGSNWVYTAGGDEYYNSEGFPLSGPIHQESSLGWTTAQMGKGEILSAAMDPGPVNSAVTKPGGGTWANAFRAGGIIWMSNSTGGRTRSYQIFGQDDPGTFGKAAGIGDLELLCDLAPIEIGNRVWNDTNADGIQDATETPIAGVTVDLYQGASLVGTAVTGADGSYYFGGTGNRNVTTALLPSTAYSIRIDNSADYTGGGPLVGKVNTRALSGTNVQIDSNATRTTPTSPIGVGNFPTIDFTSGVAGANDLTLDFGFTPPASVGDRVWVDTNGDGIQDGGEAGLSGVTVTLMQGVSTIGTTTTDGSGNYLFSNLTPGTYTVVFTQPPGYSLSPTNAAGSTTANDSNGLSSTVTLAAGQTDLTYDLGVFQPAALGDFVWADVNNNGIQDSGEVGVAGVAVRLLQGVTTIGTTTTDGAGAYQFTGLAPGTYTVFFTQPSGYNLSPTNASGSTTANDSNGLSSSTTLVSGQTDNTLDLGLVAFASVGDRVWLDTNANGIQDGGESGVSGVTVTLMQGVTTIGTTTTDASGFYSFTSLTPGTYTVVFTQPTGYGLSPTNAPGSTTANDSNGLSSSVTLAAGQNDLTYDLGLTLGSIGDTIWHDQNFNNTYDAGEGLANVLVTLRWAGADGSFGTGDDVVTTQSTDTVGQYLFSGLLPGNYRVTVATTGNAISTLSLGNVIDPDGGLDSTSVLALPAGGVNLLQDFAYRRIANDKMYYADLNGVGCTSNSVIAVTSALRLSTQQLVVRLNSGCVPTVGQTFDVLTAPSISGDFSASYGTLLPGGNVMKVQVLSNKVRLTVLRGFFVTTALDQVDATIGDGTCATAAGTCSLRAAVQEANATVGEDAVVLPAGNVFNLTLLGAGEDTAAAGDLDVTEASLILGAGSTIDGQGADRILHLLPSAAGVNVQGLTIRNGNVGSSGAGCIYNQGGSAWFTAVTLDNCHGVFGGGFGASGGTSTFIRGAIKNSDASVAGGGIAAFGTVFIDATTVQNNTTGGTGGGLFVSDASGPASLTVVNSTVSGNTSANQGGGASTSGNVALSISQSTLSGNKAVDGGAVNVTGVAVLTEARVTGNQATTGRGGAVFVQNTASASFTATRTTFDGNTAAVEGGGVANGKTVVIKTSTFSGNTAPVGAAIANIAATPAATTLTDTTITKNSASGGGSVNTAAGTTTVKNTIVSDQTLGANCSGIAPTSQGYNHSSDATCALSGIGDAQGVTANLGPLALNGGFSPTHKPNVGSPVINTGNPTCTGPDQRGWARPRGGKCEKGSIEL